ncbi:MAG: GMC family oxidoreductase [Polyangiales bacterium]
MAAIEDVADYVIVGTGAGGATAARVLAAAGHDVVLLDEGPRLRTADRPRDLLGAMRQSFRDFGTSATMGALPLPLLQGRCVGGSTAINSGIIWRTPGDVLSVWRDEWGLAELADERALSDAFDVIERELEITETARAVWGGNSDLMARGAEALGLPGKPISRNAARCQGNAQCLQGCPGEARQSMDVSYVPRALRDGARLHALARVDRVVFEGTRAVGVEGAALDADRRAVGKLRVRARRAVIVSASAVQSPVVLRRSGLKGMVGGRFMAHPGCAVVGRFPDPVGMSFGGTQAYEVPLRERGMKLESLSLPPEMLAARLPGAGAAWAERLAQLDHFAQWAVQVRMEAVGTVRPAWFGTGSDAVVRYSPTPKDMLRVREGVAILCRMMFAAGATEVYPGISGAPSVMRDPGEVSLIEAREIVSTDATMVASHLFASCPAGSDPSRAAVGPDLAVHGVSGLYVMDASALPTNLGVNPQHTIMGVVWRAAERLAHQERAAAA